MIGVHIGKESRIIKKDSNLKRIHDTVLDAIKYESKLLRLTAVSLFTSGPQNSRRNKIQYTPMKQFCDDNNISRIPHSSFVTSVIWHITRANQKDEKSKYAIRLLSDQLQDCTKIGGLGTVVHIPRQEISTVVEALEVISNYKRANWAEVILELPASKPDDLLTYETADKLNKIVAAIMKSKTTLKWCLCIDSAHQYAGAVNFKTDWDSWLSELTPETKSKIKVIHFNGALGENYGNGKDLHIIPLSKDDALFGDLVSESIRDFLGRHTDLELTKMDLFTKLEPHEIATIKNSSFFRILQFCKSNNVTAIFEINRGTFADTKFLMDCCHGLLAN